MIEPDSSVSIVMRGAVEHQIHELVLERSTSSGVMPVASYGFVINDEYSINSDGSSPGPRKVIWVIKQVCFHTFSYTPVTNAHLGGTREMERQNEVGYAYCCERRLASPIQ